MEQVEHEGASAVTRCGTLLLGRARAADGQQWPPWRRRSRLAVVLGGGATLGAFQAGVIDVLARHGVVPDLLVGTSVGAINAAFWAFDPSPEVGDRLLRLWMAANRWTMVPDGRIPIVGRFVQGKHHLTTQRGMEAAMRGAFPPGADIEDSRIALAVVAAEAVSGEKVVLRGGPLLPALLASSAIPVLFPPVAVDGRSLMDGGVVANCDVETAVGAGMTDVLVVDVMGEGLSDGATRLSDIALRALTISLRRQTDLAVRAVAGQARVALLRPRLAARPSFGDFDLTTPLFRWGQRAAAAFSAQRMRGHQVRPGLFEHDTADGPAKADIA
jgi:NTE family protein